MIKYVVCPGWIPSKNDKDIHFISSRRLIELYGVRREECYIFNDTFDQYKDFTGLIPLLPRYRGDYNRLPNPIMNGVVLK